MNRKKIQIISAVTWIFCFACAAPGKVGQKERVFDFWMESTAGLGAEINKDPAKFGRLFTLPSGNIQSETPQKSWLGINMRLEDGEPTAIQVLRVFPESSAELAGLQEGDRIIAIDGEELSPGEERSILDHFSRVIREKPPGEKARLSIRRNDSTQYLTVTLMSRPKSKPILKPRLDLEKSQDLYSNSLISFALKKEGLETEYARTMAEIRERTAEMMSPLVKGKDYNPFRLQEVNYVLSNPLNLPMVAHKITEELHRSFNKEHQRLPELIHLAMEELDMDYTSEPLKKPSDLAEYIDRLVNAIELANAMRSEILSVLTADEIELIYKGAESMLKEEPDVEKKEEFGDRQKKEAELATFFKIALKLDLHKLMSAALLVGEAIDIETLLELKKREPKLNRYMDGWVVSEEENMTIVQTSAGKVLIGGQGNNVYREDAALILDLGGDDVYFNRAGGSTLQYPFAAVIDLSGNDLYSSADDFAQGAGVLGGGFLVDLEGNDRYFARNHAQGAGVFGAGLLVDLAGHDEYKAASMVQGAGFFGIGILAEGGGNDRYFADRFAQGFGYVKGFGSVVEVSGNDNYFAGGTFQDDRQPNKAYQSMSQGFGFGMRPFDILVGASGGIGVLADAEGNDTYVGDYFSQGASYWFALGILADKKGHDNYISGRYSQGAGIHLSAGILMDGEGDDLYLSYFGVSQGCGHDLSIGILLDNGGDDRYIAGVTSQGAGNDNGIGILNDNGGNDEYYIKGLGQGRGNYFKGRGLGSFGFHFDTGGGDDFYSPSGKNNHLIFKTDWGIFADTN